MLENIIWLSDGVSEDTTDNLFGRGAPPSQKTAHHQNWFFPIIDLLAAVQASSPQGDV